MWRSVVTRVADMCCRVPRQFTATSTVTGRFTALSTSTIAPSGHLSRTISSFCKFTTPAVPLLVTRASCSALLRPESCTVTATQSYKVRTSLKRRCKHCYFAKRKGRMYIECRAKGRHKVMQQMSKRKLFLED